MEKKRREKYSVVRTKNSPVKMDSFKGACNLVNEQKICAITTKKYKLKEHFGVGLIDTYKFEGLHISIFDIQLWNDVSISGNNNEDYLELNYLLEGEQIVKIENYKKDIAIENQECYLAYISNFEGSVHYHKNKHFKELKIRMSDSFIKRHHLDSDYQIIKNILSQKL